MSPRKNKIIESMDEDPPPPAPIRNNVRWIPGLLVLLLAVFLSFFEQYFLPVRIPVVDQRALQPIRAPYDFVFNEQSALEKVVEQDLRDFIPVYEYDVGKSRQILTQLESFFNGIQECRSGTASGNEKPDKCVRALFDVPPANGGVTELLRFPHLEKLKALLTTIVAEILEKGVYSEKEVPSRTAFLRVASPYSEEPQVRSIGDVISLPRAQEVLKDRLDLLRINLSVQEILYQRARSLIEPNLHYSLDNEKKLADIRDRRSERKLILYRRGDLLVARGQNVARLDLYRVEDCLAKQRPDFLMVGMGSFIPFFVLTFLFLLSLQRVQLADPTSSRPYLLVFFILFAVLLLSKVLYLFTNLTGFAMPIGATGLVLALLLDLPTALLATLVIAVYTTFLTNLDMGLFMYYLIGGALLVLFTRGHSKRLHLLFSSLLVGAINVLIISCVLLLRDEPPSQTLLLQFAPQAFLSAPGSWLIATLLIPLAERMFRLASADRLRELADLNHPLLRRLVDRAPGTYYHSLSVANLACAAAEAVKADVLLTRVAAYYHDVGKLMEPEYFIENQNGRNPHDGLDPAASYEIVKAHTKDGVEIVTEYRFPHVVIDLIAEHHGTTVMEGFFSKAQQNHSDSYCSRDFFRYDGPKPSRVESAILMIADVVEAMARVASTHHPSKVREMVHKVIVRKFDDGQFDRCALHTHTLSQIESAITQTLLGFLHKRIEYPEGEAGRAKVLEG